MEQHVAPPCTEVTKVINKSAPPFLKHLTKKNDNAQFKQFLDILRQLHINIYFVDALEQMPNYVKFLKNILSNICQLKEFEVVALMEECTAAVKNTLQTKLKDPRSFKFIASLEE